MSWCPHCGNNGSDRISCNNCKPMKKTHSDPDAISGHLPGLGDAIRNALR